MTARAFSNCEHVCLCLFRARFSSVLWRGISNKQFQEQNLYVCQEPLYFSFRCHKNDRGYGRRQGPLKTFTWNPYWQPESIGNMFVCFVLFFVIKMSHVMRKTVFGSLRGYGKEFRVSGPGVFFPDENQKVKFHFFNKELPSLCYLFFYTRRGNTFSISLSMYFLPETL